MIRIIDFSKKHIYPLLIIVLWLTICIFNYKWGTYLSGWDTLHPEFNYSEYWKRVLFSVWQPHQGLGAVATQAHAAEIPRMIILHFLDLLFPASFVRWSYFFLMLLLGPLGVYFLISYLFRNTPRESFYSSHPSQEGTKRVMVGGFAFVGALFYLLNLGTLQHFYVPLEMFATLYGFIGWLFLYLLKFLKEGGRRNLLIFSIFTFFSAPMAHTSTLWVVYFIFLVVFLFTYVLLERNKGTWVRAIKTTIATVFVNLFWLLPNLYFVFTHSRDVTSAKITSLFTEEAILNNQEYANIFDIALLKGFLFNWSVPRESTNFEPIFNVWESHLSTWSFLGYLFFLVILIGLIFTFKNLKNGRNKFVLSFIPIFFISLFFLLMNTPPTGYLYSLLIENTPLLKDAMRLPYTKFSIHLMLIYSIFFAFGVYYFNEITHLLKVPPLTGGAPKGVGGVFRYLKSKYLFVGIFTLSLLIYSLPVFKGHLIGDIEKINFSREYFEAFEYLNENESSRIATLPAHFLFGWQYYDWNKSDRDDVTYQGAGFTWFLSENPLTEREFDRWYPTNEQFYNEFQYAVYSKDAELMGYLINKYQLNYLLLDKNVIAPGSPRATFYEETQNLLGEVSSVRLDRQFGNILIYTTGINTDFKADSHGNTLLNPPVREDLNSPLTGGQGGVRNYVYAPDSFLITNIQYEFSNVDSFGVSENVKTLKRENGNMDYVQVSHDTSYNIPHTSYNPLFPDDRELAKLLQTPSTLLPISGSYGISNGNDSSNIQNQTSSIYIPDLPQNEPIPARISVEGGNLNVTYLYPRIVDDLDKEVYSPHKSLDHVFSAEPADINRNILINGNPYSGSFDVEALLSQSSQLITFTANPDVIYDYSNRLYSIEPFDCSDTEIGSFGKQVDDVENSITLLSQNKSVCAPIEQNILIEEPSVIRVEFEHKSEGSAQPLYCLSSTNSDDCLNEKYADSPLINSEYKNYIDYVFVPNQDEVYISLILENLEQTSEAVSFKNIKVSVYPVLENINLSPSLQDYNIGTNLTLDPERDYFIEFPDYGLLEKSFNPGSPYYNPEPKNCDNFNEGDFDRNLVPIDPPLPVRHSLGEGGRGVPEGRGVFYEYTATDAISCDSIKTAGINPSTGWIFTFKNEWVKGKGLDICIAGTNLDKCMLQDRLNKSNSKIETRNLGNPNYQLPITNNYETESFILPPYKTVEEVRVNIGNQSIGRVDTENHFYGLDVEYIPYKWIKGIGVKNTNRTNGNEFNGLLGGDYPQQGFIPNQIELVDVNKKGTHFYEVRANVKTSKRENADLGLIILNQSFENGWGLYDKSSCFLSMKTPLTCKKANAEHILAKNWANGWIIEDMETLEGENVKTFLIIFWPQYLQYLGYAFLLMWFGYLFFKVGSNRQKSA